MKGQEPSSAGPHTRWLVAGHALRHIPHDHRRSRCSVGVEEGLAAGDGLVLHIIEAKVSE